MSLVVCRADEGNARQRERKGEHWEGGMREKGEQRKGEHKEY